MKPVRNPDSAPGDWFIDSACIDCGASRHVAPGLVVARNGKSVFARQPATAEERLAAWRAVLVCPTASVRSEHKQPRPEGPVFPQDMTKGVWRCGFNARASFGAHSYFVRHAGGNVLVDSPRYASELVHWFETQGGIGQILLSHQDDVADASKYAQRFGSRVWIHEHDRGAAPFATDILEGETAVAILPKLVAIPMPGHTRGSVVFLHDERVLFTGDTLAWSMRDNDLVAWRDVCWYSWSALTASMAKLEDVSFEWVLPGHGWPVHLPAEEMKTRLRALIVRMRAS
jgi:glyoxylase-like metal-dependent hydrolase (beta-lactamase superfamily II)